MNIYTQTFKPIFDFIISVLLLIILTPLVLIIFLLLGWFNRGDIFFFQNRPGKLGKPFNIIKFKTMRDAFDETGNVLPDHLRITPVGRIVRSLSLDEVLQLVNVIKGDMSLIGPRPLLPEYLPLYNKDQARRHEIRPGITGWAQVNGRNAITWEKKFELDVWYVENVSFSLDCKIFLMTLKKIFRATDINQKGQATAEKFEGNIK